MQCSALLFTILEKCKRVVDTKNVCGALLTDILKAFNCLSHKVIIGRHNTYGFNLPALNPIKNYWANGKQTAKVNYSYSCLSDILFGVPCELNLHLLLFKIFLNDLILIIWDINTFSYVDKNARHDSCDTIGEVLSVKIIQKNFFSDLQVIRLRVALVSAIL